AIKSYYVLGYYSGNGAMDGKYRKISVKLANRLDAKLEHRPGYWAGKVWNKMTGNDREQQLTEAISAARFRTSRRPSPATSATTSRSSSTPTRQATSPGRASNTMPASPWRQA